MSPVLLAGGFVPVLPGSLPLQAAKLTISKAESSRQMMRCLLNIISLLQDCSRKDDRLESKTFDSSSEAELSSEVLASEVLDRITLLKDTTSALGGQYLS